MKPKRIRAKRLVVAGADEFIDAVKKHASQFKFKSTNAFIMWALQHSMAIQKSAVQSKEQCTAD